VRRCVITCDVVGALRCLPCTNTLRTLRVTDPWKVWDDPCRADELLASLPALETLDVRADDAQPRYFLWDTGAVLCHGVRELKIECTARTSSLVWKDGFARLRRLCLRLPDQPDRGSDAALAVGLRAAVPRLEALELRWSRLSIVHDDILMGLLGEARALRKLVLPDELLVRSNAFADFVGGRLAGLEVLRLNIKKMAPPCTFSASDLLGRMPCLREAHCDGDWGPVGLCSSPTLVRFQLLMGVYSCGHPCAEIAMPALRSLKLDLGACRCSIDCPALEELDIADTQARFCSGGERGKGGGR